MTSTRAEPAQPNPATRILIIIALAVLLRLLFLGRWSLWIDEFHTLRMAREASLLTEGIPGDKHPPLYYLFMTIWITVSESEFWLRLPSAVCGILSTVVMYGIGKALDRPRLGLVAAFLVATIPLHVWYSREARMYGVVTLFWTLSIYFYIRSIQRDNWLDTAGLAVANVTAFYLAYPTLALWVLQLSFFFLGWSLWGNRPVRLVRFLLAQLAFILGILLWWPFWQIQLGRGGEFNWVLPGLDLTATLSQALTTAGGLGAILLIVVSLVSLVIARQPHLLNWIGGRAAWWGRDHSAPLRSRRNRWRYPSGSLHTTPVAGLSTHINFARRLGIDTSAAAMAHPEHRWSRLDAGHHDPVNARL